MNGKRIGLMGGTFDPIHLGHLAIAEAALAELSLDSVLFMPTGCSYLKEGRKIADREDRYEMTRLAVADNPRFLVSRMEIDRPGSTYTADTLRELSGRYPKDEWFLLMGADSYLMLHRWVRPEEICALATLVCADRAGAEGFLAGQADILRERFGAKSAFLSIGRMDISSSAIRARLAAGEDAADMLCGAVLDYIRSHGLYRQKEEPAV